MVCRDGVYDENIIRKRVNRIQIFDKHIKISLEEGSQMYKMNTFMIYRESNKINTIIPNDE